MIEWLNCVELNIKYILRFILIEWIRMIMRIDDSQRIEFLYFAEYVYTFCSNILYGSNH